MMAKKNRLLLDGDLLEDWLHKAYSRPVGVFDDIMIPCGLVPVQNERLILWVACWALTSGGTLRIPLYMVDQGLPDYMELSRKKGDFAIFERK